MKYKAIIGLETHVELKTESKMFCSCSADYFGKEPNTHTCPVCLGLPGALPVPNKKAVDWCIMIALALNCKISNISKFDRKNYFYPDLPKGYQISQYDEPFGLEGYVLVKNEQDGKDEKKIRIRRVHMEEDTGKLTHAKIDGKNATLIDFNRSGVPLVEIVTEPDFENSYQVTQYLQKLQQIVRYLEVSNADMEKGDMRLEPNISLSKEDQKELPDYKVEVKNINSFKFVQKAIEWEIQRQSEILDSGKTPVQETRGWDERKNQTVSQRVKEEASDYRYFPEPDIPPIRFTQDQISKIKDQIVELPNEKTKRFVNEFSIAEYDAAIITRDKGMADYFEEAVKAGKELSLTPKQIANHIINKKPDLKETVPAELVKTILSSKETAEIPEEELKKVIEQVIEENPKAVENYKSGKVQIIGYLIGKTRQKLPQNVSVATIKEAIDEALK